MDTYINSELESGEILGNNIGQICYKNPLYSNDNKDLYDGDSLFVFYFYYVFFWGEAVETKYYEDYGPEDLISSFDPILIKRNGGSGWKEK